MQISSEHDLTEFFKDKKVLITGGTGSIGEKLASAVLRHRPRQVIVFSRDDSKQYLMKQKFAGTRGLDFYLGDIRDYHTVEYITRGVDLVFHAAALKQVPICEDNPFEAVKTNVIGSENLIQASIANKVKKVINISTDKAVNPSNLMGATKLIAEKLFRQANFVLNNGSTRFCSVRFGNVMGSRGSVFPIFMNQVKTGQPLTITDPNMTRFIMTIEEAVGLTLKAAYYSAGGEFFILKMEALRIRDIQQAIEIYCKNKGLEMPSVQVIGIRAGEKLHEDLMTSDELNHVLEDDDLYVLPPSDEPGPLLHFMPASVACYRSDLCPQVSIGKIIHYLEQSEN